MLSWKSYRIYLPILAFLLLVVLYTIYWLVIAAEIESQVEAARAQGLEGGGRIEFSEVSISGYPFLIVATFKAPQIEDTGGSFRADELKATLRAYSLSHIIFDASGAQELTVRRITDDGRLMPMTLSGSTQSTQASLILEGGMPRRIDVDLKGFGGTARDIDGSERSLVATRIQIHARENKLADDRRNLEFAAKIENAHFTPSDDLLLGPDVALIHVSTRLADASLETLRAAPSFLQWAEQGGQVELDKILMAWGRVDLEAQGSFRLDRARRLEGSLTSHIGGYDDLVDALVGSGQLTPRDGSLAKQALALLAMAARDARGRIPVPVGFREGSLWIGPIRVAPLQPLL